MNDFSFEVPSGRRSQQQTITDSYWWLREPFTHDESPPKRGKPFLNNPVLPVVESLTVFFSPHSVEENAFIVRDYRLLDHPQFVHHSKDRSELMKLCEKNNIFLANVLALNCGECSGDLIVKVWKAKFAIAVSSGPNWFMFKRHKLQWRRL